jgi:membrane protease subunit (stomatin/prohibitin family)
MGLIQSAKGAIVGSFTDQWKDFYTVPSNLKSTTALMPAVSVSTNAGRGGNQTASEDVITNGSKFIVPEGYALILLQDGAFTGFAAEPGAYEWNEDDVNSQSIFSGDGIVSPLIKQSWDRFKFGGRPSSQQTGFFVSQQELSNNKFGTASEIYWDDSYLNAQVGALARGSYTLRISDPLLFLRNFVPTKYVQGKELFDLTDINNPAATQLFNEVISSLASALSIYANTPEVNNRMSRIQQDAVGFGRSLSEAVENNFKWRSERGLEIVSTAIVAIEYDDASRELLKTVQRADALSGSRGNSNLQASLAAGFEAAGSTEGAAGILGLGFAAGTVGVGSIQQPTSPTSSASIEDPVVVLTKYKQMLDADLISQADYDAVKAKLLNL